MFVAIWLLGLLLLALWSGTLWAAWFGWTLLADMPWSQAVDAARAAELPAWLEIWVGDAWRAALDAASPWIEWVMRVLDGAPEWLGVLVPVLLGLLWALGAFGILAATGLAVGLLGWWRRRRSRPAA